MKANASEYSPEQILHYRQVFKKRRSIRIGIAVIVLSLLLGITALAFPSWVLFGMPKMVWAPFFYLIMFGLIILIALVWRCPACNGLLGDIFSTKYCSKCGLQLSE